MEKVPANYVEMICRFFSSLFFGKANHLPGINIFLIKVRLCALLNFPKEQNVLTSFLLPNNFFISSEIIGKLLVRRLFIKGNQLPMFELTLSTVFDCKIKKVCF